MTSAFYRLQEQQVRIGLFDEPMSQCDVETRDHFYKGLKSVVGKTLVDLLSLHGYLARQAESGEQGLERLESGSFDLVLLDIRLPSMSGYETCQRVREYSALLFATGMSA